MGDSRVRNRRRKSRFVVKNKKQGVVTRAKKKAEKQRTKNRSWVRTQKYIQNDEEKYLTPAVFSLLAEDTACFISEFHYRKHCFQPTEPIRKFRKECSVYCGDEDCSNLTCLDCGHWAHPECLDHLLRTHGSSCPLCKASIDHLRTDAHYDAIDEYIEEQYQEDLEAAIAASLAMAAAAEEKEAEEALGVDDPEEEDSGSPTPE